MCQERVGEVMAALRGAGLDDGSIKLYAVSTGTPATSHGVAKELGLCEPATAAWASFLCDEDAELYNALAAHRGVLRTFTWKKWANVVGLCASFAQCCKGRLPQVNAGDPWQQGGVFVCGAKGTMLFEHRETSPGWPPLQHDAFLAAAKRAAGKA